ncbi:MAG: DUF5666 domain-containing protein [Chloroflexota bacterium]
MKIKNIKNIFVLMLVGVLVFMQVGSAFAQEEEPPEEDTCVNPIAGLFDAYYGADTGEGQAAGIVDEITETSITVDGVPYIINEETVVAEGVVAGDEVTVDYYTDENEDFVATNVALGAEEVVEETSICDEVTAYHEDGMGWGVLVKLYAIADESMEACDGEEDCGVTVEELVEMFNSGTGMGQLFKEFGKPAQLGVGHLRKAVKNCETASDDDTETADTSTADDGSGNGKGKGKGKGNNGNGGGDDDGDGTTTSQGNGNGKGGKGGNGNGAENGQGNAGGDDGDTIEPADTDDDEGEPDEDDGEPDEGDSAESAAEEDDCANGDDAEGTDTTTTTSQSQGNGNGKSKGKGKNGK